RRPLAGPQNRSQRADPDRDPSKSPATVANRVLRPFRSSLANRQRGAHGRAGHRPTAGGRSDKGSEFNRRDGGPISTGLDKDARLSEHKRTDANARPESTSWGSLVRAQYRPLKDLQIDLLW